MTTDFLLISRVFVTLSLVIVTEAASGSGRPKEQPRHRPVSLYLTHGYSHINNHQLSRLSFGKEAFAAGAGAGFHLPSGLGIDAEFLALNSRQKDSADYGSRYISQATTTFRQERLTLGGSYRYFLGRNFALFPEVGLSYNRVEVGLSEFSFSLRDSVNAAGVYLGVGAVVPIRRVFFDFRAKYSMVDLEMKKLGVDSPMYQVTVLVGFGFVI